MSLNKSLNRLFDEIRREARRNEAFADRLDAVLRAHDSERDVPDAVLEDVLRGETERGPPVRGGREARAPDHTALNPVALYSRDGAEALKAALIELPEGALAHLVGEHNLDPAGAAADLAKPDLVDHIVAQAARRVERDRKLFDY